MGGPPPSKRSRYAQANAAVISAKSTQHLDQASAVQARRAEVAEKARELNENREGDQDADERDHGVVRRVVGEARARRPRRRRARAEGASASRTGPCRRAGDSCDRDRRRGSAAAPVPGRRSRAPCRESERRARGAATGRLRATARPPSSSTRARSRASEKPSTWLPESPRKTAAGFPRRTLKGRNPAHANATARDSTSTSAFECTVTASIAK